jgi:hypothetical protein
MQPLSQRERKALGLSNSRAGKPRRKKTSWTSTEVMELFSLLDQGLDIPTIATHFNVYPLQIQRAIGWFSPPKPLILKIMKEAL